MSTLKESLKNTTITEWIVSIGGIFLFIFLFHFSNIPRIIIDPFAYFFAGSLFIYSCFFKKSLGTIKNRLYNAMFGGAFIYLFIESISKLFAKWAVWKFF